MLWEPYAQWVPATSVSPHGVCLGGKTGDAAERTLALEPDRPEYKYCLGHVMWSRAGRQYRALCESLALMSDKSGFKPLVLSLTSCATQPLWINVSSSVKWAQSAGLHKTVKARENIYSQTHIAIYWYHTSFNCFMYINSSNLLYHPISKAFHHPYLQMRTRSAERLSSLSEITQLVVGMVGMWIQKFSSQVELLIILLECRWVVTTHLVQSYRSVYVDTHHYHHHDRLLITASPVYISASQCIDWNQENLLCQN